jgi:hypothetical protein
VPSGTEISVAQRRKQKVAGFQQRKGVRAQQIAQLHRQAFRRRRRVRQRQAVERQRTEQAPPPGKW